MVAEREIFKIYEQEIGCLTPLISQKIDGYLYDPKCSRNWLIDAIYEAARNNARKWSYVEAILNRWMVNGRQVRIRAPVCSGDRHRDRKPELAQKLLSPEELKRAREYAKMVLLPGQP